MRMTNENFKIHIKNQNLDKLSTWSERGQNETVNCVDCLTPMYFIELNQLEVLQKSAKYNQNWKYNQQFNVASLCTVFYLIKICSERNIYFFSFEFGQLCSPRIQDCWCVLFQLFNLSQCFSTFSSILTKTQTQTYQQSCVSDLLPDAHLCQA